MELYWIYIVCVILCVRVDESNEQSNAPASPCPNMFQYQYDGQWYGSAQLQSAPLGQPTKLEVMLSLRAQLPTQDVGQLSLFGTREQAIQEIRSNQPVRYRIRFPLQSPLPKLTQISVNGRVHCTGPSETGPYVTQIRLEHTLFTEFAATGYPSVPVSGFDNSINNHDPFVIYNNQDNYYNHNYNYNYQTRPTAPGPTYTPPTSQPPIYPVDKYPGYPGYQSYTPPQVIPPPQVDTAPVIPPQPEYSSYPTAPSTYAESEICGKPHDRFNFATLVVGGENVSRGAWPWLVAVYLNKATGPTFNCGGNLVSSKVVVTAAHCFRTTDKIYRADEVILFLGRYNILNWNENGIKAVDVEQIVIHSDYMTRDTSYDADIALAIMRERVEFTEFIRPICLWEGTGNINEVENQLGTVIGWGRDGLGNIVTSQPKKINVPVVPEAVCLRSSDTYRYITSKRTFCAGKRDGTGPCNGDSGSGMTFNRNNRWMLRGIVSAALADPVVNTCNLMEYVVFTDAAKFVSWIKSYMR